MFSSSTQLRKWIFADLSELDRIRDKTNKSYVTLNSSPNKQFLDAREEKLILQHYVYVIKEFCANFQPPMPVFVVGTSINYFKRFYLLNSVMDYHPKYIIYTCVYLACKTEEFHVSIASFASNVRGDREDAAEIILTQELLLMQKLNYQLTIHNPYRPLEGLLLDIKIRCSSVTNVDQLRKGAEEFIDRSLNTDCLFIFAPSQVALAAVLSSAAKQGLNLDSYVTNTLLSTTDKKDTILKTVDQIKRIKNTVRSIKTLNREEVRSVENKLLNCQNQENNPESLIYMKKFRELDDEIQEGHQTKRRKISQEQDSLDLLND